MNLKRKYLSVCLSVSSVRVISYSDHIQYTHRLLGGFIANLAALLLSEFPNALRMKQLNFAPNYSKAIVKFVRTTKAFY